MAIRVPIGTLIDQDPAIRGGRPKIAGTAITVARVAGWYQTGMTPDEIAGEYAHLTLAQVHAALAYYHANRDEIDTDIARNSAESSEWEHRLSVPQRPSVK